MDFLQLGACAAGFVALEDLDVVFEVELFEEPDDALGAGLLEPVVWLSADALSFSCEGFFLAVRRRLRRYVVVGGGEGLHVQNVPVDGDLCTLLVSHDEGFASVQRIFLVLIER